jgi:hypothetical protein
LTGKPPFSGRLAQLAAQYQNAAVPVDLVDLPLRALVARGMAKDPAARAPNAAEFVAELEATAAAAYGAGWESAGRRRLTAQAAALALLLYGTTGGAAAGAGSGASSTVTWLSTVKGAFASHAFIYTGIAAAVIGIIGGSLAGISRATQHPPSSTAASATAPPARPSATPQPTIPVSAACGSFGPALAYLVGRGSVDSTESVVVRCGTGAPRELGSFQFFNDPSRPSLAWSADGTQVAWVTSTALYVAQASHGAWSLRHWACQVCGGIAFQSEQAVTAGGQAAGGPLTSAIPELLVFPASGPARR